MNILITGGAGFIGSHLAKFYAKKWEGHKILVLDNFLRKGYSYHIRELRLFKNVEVEWCDIRDYNPLHYQIEHFEPDIIFHCAGQTAVTTSYEEPYEDFQVNVVGTVNLLEIIRKASFNPVIVFCSTNKVFGLCPNGDPTPETFRTDLSPFTPYGVSKNCADLYMREYANAYGLKTGIFRMSCIYGPQQFGIEDQGWVAHFIISALQEKKITIFGDGTQKRDILYITDLIHAFESFVNNANNLKGEVFCMGGGPMNIISLNELITLLGDILEKKIERNFEPWRRNDQKVYISDISKAQKTLNWEPKISVLEGIKKVIEWAKTNINLIK